MVIVLIAAIEFIRYREIETVLQPICSTCIILEMTRAIFIP